MQIETDLFTHNEILVLLPRNLGDAMENNRIKILNDDSNFPFIGQEPVKF